MRSHSVKAALFFVLVLTLRLEAQTNPHTQIRWPANCNTANMVYSDQAVACINAVVGPTIDPSAIIAWPANCNAAYMVYNYSSNTCFNGAVQIAAGTTTTLPPGSNATVTQTGTFPSYTLNFGIPAGTPGGSLSYPGVATDNANGLAVQGGITTGGILAVQGGITTGGISVNVYGGNTFTNNGLMMFGDSITYPNGAGAQTSGCTLPSVPAGYCQYSTVMAARYGQGFINRAAIGDMAEDQVWGGGYSIFKNISTPSRTGNVPATILIGVNDANACGASTGCQNNYFHTLLAGVAHTIIPADYRIQPSIAVGSATCTATGTWTTATLGTITTAYQSIVPGSSLTCSSLYNAATNVYGAWYAKDGYTASASFAVDGTTVDTWNAFGYNGQAILSQHGNTDTIFAARYALTGGGVHTFKITVNTAGSGNPFIVAFLAQPSGANNYLGGPTLNPPVMVVGGVLRQQGDGKSTTTATYDTLAQSVSTALSGDGMFAPFANVRAKVGTDYATLDSDMSAATLPNGLQTPASAAPGLHPNGGNSNGVWVGGNAHLYDAFTSVLPPVTPANPGSLSLADNYSHSASYTLTPLDGYTGFTCSTACTLTLPNFSPNPSPAFLGPFFVTNYGGATLNIAYGSGAANCVNGTAGGTACLPSTLAPGTAMVIHSVLSRWALDSSLSPSILNLHFFGATTNYTLLGTDAMVVLNASTAQTLTVPTGLQRGPYFIGNYGTAAWTITAGAGASLHGIISTINPSGGVVLLTDGTNWFSGSNYQPARGTTTLAAGTVTVTNAGACVATTSCVYKLTTCSVGGTPGILSIGTVIAGTSFVINSSNAADASQVCWQIN